MINNTHVMKIIEVMNFNIKFLHLIAETLLYLKTFLTV